MYERFENYIRAGFPFIWVNTCEPDRAQNELADIAKSIHQKPASRWDVVSGTSVIGTLETQPCSPVKAIEGAAAAKKQVTIFWNLHRFLGSIEIIQAIQNAIQALKYNASCIVVLAPDSDKIPAELSRFVVVWDFPLPDQAQIGETMSRIRQDAELPEIENTAPLVDAAIGLTVSEAEDAFALSVVEKRTLDPDVISREKAGALLRQAKITLERYPDHFSDLGGLDNLKKFTLSTAPSPLSLGCFLLGVPGAGKSTFARCLGNELGIPTLSLDFGRMMGSLVGQSEAAIRDALKSVDAMGRVVLFIDELDKGLAGSGSSGDLDSGTKAGVAGTFLKWLSDRTPGKAYVIATANKVSNIPPEYLRSERWDSLWYLDLPNAQEKDAIWEIWLKRFKLTDETSGVDDMDWTGAEIRSCCRIASMMKCDIEDAARYVIPVAKSMSESITSMRDWAKGRCLPASLVAPTIQKEGRQILRRAA
jgi:SpoVK/Ycf46/Vps4 family AAA+-type ATPase